MRHASGAAGEIEVLKTPGVQLEITTPHGPTQVMELRVPQLTIGRAPECELVLNDPAVSRRHARIECCAGGVMVANLSRSGHTLADGVPLAEPKVLGFGTEIAIAGYRLRFTSTEQRQAPRGDFARERVQIAVRPDRLPERPSQALRQQLEDTPQPVKHPVRKPEQPTEAVRQAERPSQAAKPAEKPAPRVEPAGEHGAHLQGGVDAIEHDRVKRWLRDRLLEAIDLRAVNRDDLKGDVLHERVAKLADQLIDDNARKLPAQLDRARMRKELCDELLGLGPLEDFLRDPAVTEIMVIDRANIFVEKKGKVTFTGSTFSTDDALRLAIERIVTPLGRRIDESTPMVDARLPDGSRVNAVIPPVALRGPTVTIRKFPSKRMGIEDLIGYGSMDERMARFLQRSVIARCNVLVSGGTGSGKTTLLNILSGAIPSDERIVTIEDAAELKLQQPHVVSLETRPANMEGKGAIAIRDLVKNALRMRPDRVVVGECRGGEALDMLQAMNTGHDGSLTTLHANSPAEAMSRLETLVLMGGLDLPTRAIREQIASAVHLVVQQTRLNDGSRKVTDIAEVVGIEEDGHIRTESIFKFVREAAAQGEVKGTFKATGYLPSYLGKLVTLGLCDDGVFI